MLVLFPYLKLHVKKQMPQLGINPMGGLYYEGTKPSKLDCAEKSRDLGLSSDCFLPGGSPQHFMSEHNVLIR